MERVNNINTYATRIRINIKTTPYIRAEARGVFPREHPCHPTPRRRRRDCRITVSWPICSAARHPASHCADGPPSCAPVHSDAGGTASDSGWSHSSTSARANCSRLTEPDPVESGMSEGAVHEWVSASWWARRVAASWSSMRKWLTRIPMVLRKRVGGGCEMCQKTREWRGPRLRFDQERTELHGVQQYWVRRRW